jgi:hypothetical protein
MRECLCHLAQVGEKGGALAFLVGFVLDAKKPRGVNGDEG